MPAKITCQHPIEHVINTHAGRFCMDCGHVIGRATVVNKIVRHSTKVRPRTVRNTKQLIKKPTVQIQTAGIHKHA